MKHEFSKDGEEKTEEQMKPQQQQGTLITNPPWIDLRLTKETMDHLWDDINESKQIDARKKLAGNISKSYYIQDNKDWFYKNVLKDLVEHTYYQEWVNYYNVHVAKSALPPVFKLNELWVNFQKQLEFNPPHCHTSIFSFVVFMKIPTHWKEQHALPISANSSVPCASNFQFLLGQGIGSIIFHNIPLCPEDEGRILFFPSWLTHQVFPFYECEEERITISGNIIPTHVHLQ